MRVYRVSEKCSAGFTATFRVRVLGSVAWGLLGCKQLFVCRLSEGHAKDVLFPEPSGRGRTTFFDVKNLGFRTIKPEPGMVVDNKQPVPKTTLHVPYKPSGPKKHLNSSPKPQTPAVASQLFFSHSGPLERPAGPF